jgi:hypothetical protein
MNGNITLRSQAIMRPASPSTFRKTKNENKDISPHRPLSAAAVFFSHLSQAGSWVEVAPPFCHRGWVSRVSRS